MEETEYRYDTQMLIEGTDLETPAKTAASALSKGLGSVSMPKFSFSWATEKKSVSPTMTPLSYRPIASVNRFPVPGTT